eukprot:scaffold4934_cov128-Isochrysis_galbana.AAC.9
MQGWLSMPRELSRAPAPTTLPIPPPPRPSRAGHNRRTPRLTAAGTDPTSPPRMPGCASSSPCGCSSGPVSRRRAVRR